MKRHEILFFPAWDKTDPDPKKNYGVSPLVMRFIVHGDRGAVEFELYTNWYLPHVMERRLHEIKKDVFRGEKDYMIGRWVGPSPMDICRYSKERLTEDDTFFEHGVRWITGEGQPCYYNYKSGQSDRLFEILVRNGIEAVWSYLDAYYDEEFGRTNEARYSVL